MKNLVLLILSICFSITYAQKDKRCKCPKTEFISDKYGTIFDLSNGRRFLVCGSVNDDTDPPTYSEFIIAECGKKSIIDFWNDSKTCEISFKNDTLYLKQLEELPIGSNFKMETSFWGIEKIYYTGDKVMRKTAVNKKLKKYSPLQISAVIKAYESTKISNVNEAKMVLANKLLIATMCGSQKAKQHLIDFKTKFKLLDSDYIEQYNEIISKLDTWEKK